MPDATVACCRHCEAWMREDPLDHAAAYPHQRPCRDCGDPPAKDASVDAGHGPWLPFGTHAVMDRVPRLAFGSERGEDLLPLHERHMYPDAWACPVCLPQGGQKGDDVPLA